MRISAAACLVCSDFVNTVRPRRRFRSHDIESYLSAARRGDTSLRILGPTAENPRTDFFRALNWIWPFFCSCWILPINSSQKVQRKYNQNKMKNKFIYWVRPDNKSIDILLIADPCPYHNDFSYNNIKNKKTKSKLYNTLKQINTSRQKK